ncbi:hypothetical protein [Viridibacillus arvi]|uniref:hypothetical protein n=1 Tax=Viridibacillus arvi TaxID=263475 RepID=UPI0034CE28F3
MNIVLISIIVIFVSLAAVVWSVINFCKCGDIRHASTSKRLFISSVMALILSIVFLLKTTIFQ